MKKYIAVRTKYYKPSKGKSLEWHIRRDNKNKNTASVYDEFSKNNIHHEIRSRASCRAEYKKLNGRKVRNDFNEIFEHMLILSEDQYSFLEEKYKDKGPDAVKQAICKLVDEYGEKIKDKYGFEPLRYDLHLDEGHYDENGEFKRNIHVHVMFYNYDFKARKEHLNSIDNDPEEPPVKRAFAPLKGVQKKVRDSDGNLNVNPAFADFQDIAADTFKKAGFVRGQKKSVTNAVHKKRDEYITEKQKEKMNHIKTLKTKILSLMKAKDHIENEITNIKNSITDWFQGILYKFDVSLKAEKTAKAIDKIEPVEPDLSTSIDKNIEEFETKNNISENQKITNKRKRRKRKRP